MRLLRVLAIALAFVVEPRVAAIISWVVAAAAFVMYVAPDSVFWLFQPALEGDRYRPIGNGGAKFRGNGTPENGEERRN